MKLIKSRNANENYLSKIVRINNFHKHPNADKLKCCTVDGFNIITGIDSEPGLYVYFPTMSQINKDFLSYANLYRHKELNNDPEKSGMFNDNGRVTSIKLRGELSEGFILPIITLQNYIVSISNKELENVKEGTEFDSIQDDQKEFWISRKYVVKQESKQLQIQSKTKEKKFDRIINSQFRFHRETIVIKKCPHVITPESIIHISSKWHGTSCISAYVLCKQKLNIKQRIAKLLTGEQFNKYDYVYSSRTVIKNQYGDSKHSYYEYDIWGEADKIIRPHLIKGLSVYYEIVGYLPNGNYIQKGYDYGCVPPKSNEDFTINKHFKIYIYRITYTNIDGEVFEFTARQVQAWCNKEGLQSMIEFYYGKAKDLYPDLDTSNHWNEEFLNKLSNDKKFYMECNSPDCNNKVPHEGLVFRLDNNPNVSFKLKCFKFISGEQAELDNNEINIENNS